MKIKLLSLIVISLFSINAMAAKTLLNCTVTVALDTSIFKDSLSVDKHPKVVVTSDEVNGFEITIGSNLFNLDNYNTITREPSVGMDIIFQITNNYNDEIIRLIVGGFPRQGEIYVQSTAFSGIVATVDCD